MGGSYVPGTIYADPSGSTHNSIAPRVIPVIFVPGNLASRLAEPNGGPPVWNPYAGVRGRSPGNLAFGSGRALRFTDGKIPTVGDDRIANVGAPLEPDSWNTTGYEPDAQIAAVDDAWRAANGRSEPVWSDIEGFFEPICDFHDKLMIFTRIQLEMRLKPRGMVPKMYGCGYDWRQSNVFSAARLKKLVDRVVAETGEKAILIAHSMGGLVSRYFLKALGGERSVRALILLASPTLGAPQAYAYLKRGIGRGDELGFLFGLRAIALWENEGESMAFNRSMPSFYQLLPNEIYCKLEPHWLELDVTQTGYPYYTPPGSPPEPLPFSDCTQGYKLYQDIYAGFAEDMFTRSANNSHVDQARAFHAAITVDGKAYMHPITHAVVCQDLPTTTTIQLPKYGEVVIAGNGAVEYRGDLHYNLDPSWGSRLTRIAPVGLGQPSSGDTSVSYTSGMPPDAWLSNPFKSVYTAEGVSHTEIPNDQNVINHVVLLIDSILDDEASARDPAYTAPSDGDATPTDAGGAADEGVSTAGDPPSPAGSYLGQEAP